MTMHKSGADSLNILLIFTHVSYSSICIRKMNFKQMVAGEIFCNFAHAFQTQLSNKYWDQKCTTDIQSK